MLVCYPEEVVHCLFDVGSFPSTCLKEDASELSGELVAQLGADRSLAVVLVVAEIDLVAHQDAGQFPLLIKHCRVPLFISSKLSRSVRLKTRRRLCAARRKVGGSALNLSCPIVSHSLNRHFSPSV